MRGGDDVPWQFSLLMVVVFLVAAVLLRGCVVSSKTEECLKAFPQYTRQQCEFIANQTPWR